jgi:pilus assembly protein Flp/PilA
MFSRAVLDDSNRLIPCLLRFAFAIAVLLLLEEAMKNLALKVQRFLVTEDGPTAVEYAVMLALIVIVCLTAIQAIGTNASATFTTVAGQL